MAVRRILFVDDELNVLQALRRLLSKEYEIETAEGARKGLQALADSGPYAVVVSDLRMPEVDGNQFISEVRRHSPEIVTLVLSGNINAEATVASQSNGVFQVLAKPCPAAILKGALNAALAQYERARGEGA